MAKSRFKRFKLMEGADVKHLKRKATVAKRQADLAATAAAIAAPKKSPIDMTPLTNGERARTYVWPNAVTNTIQNVTHICARPSGSHRLQTADGLKHIVPSGWIQLVIDADEWSA